MKEDTIALLIDKDNVSSKYVKIIFDELSSYGKVTIRRIYGNWQKSNGWNEEILLEYSIQPIQQFDYTKCKNASDIAMVIDAMDILFTNEVDVFCIVTSDSDFTKLAMRLRESKSMVIGMGESKTPKALTKSCNKFVHLDLIASDESEMEEQSDNKAKGGKLSDDTDSNVTPLKEIEETVTNLIAESDNLSLGEVGSSLSKLFTDFDVRNYGYTKLSILFREEFPNIEILEGSNNTFFVKMKNDLDIKTIHKEITSIIKKNHGVVENLSLIHEALKREHAYFNFKDYGFSRFSRFLNSFDDIDVVNNKVKLKKKR